MNKYTCKRCGYETESENAEKEEKERYGLCWQCWIDRDSPCQSELESRF